MKYKKGDIVEWSGSLGMVIKVYKRLKRYNIEWIKREGSPRWVGRYSECDIIEYCKLARPANKWKGKRR